MSLLAALAAAAALAAPAHALMPGGFGRKKEPVPSIKSDVKYIRCDVCQHIAKAAHRSVGTLRKEQPHWKPLTEDSIIEHLEMMCNPQGEQGEWILHLDVQEDGDKLKVVEMSGTGDCRRECTTIAKLCESILGDHDSDISELLFRQASRSEVANELCNELTGSCSKKPPPFSGPRPDGEDWKEVDPEELKLQRMMAQMESSGMSGDLMSRDSVMDKMEDYKEQLADQYDLSSDEVDSMLAGKSADGASTSAGQAVESGRTFDPIAGGHNAADEL